MTTICVRAGVLAGDGRETDDGDNDMVVGDHFKKVHRLKDGRLFGGAGSSENIHRLMVAADHHQAPPKLDDTTALLVDGKKVYIYEGHMWRSMTEPYYSIGTGRGYAMGAMDAGADAAKATKIASKRDPYSGGKVTALRQWR